MKTVILIVVIAVLVIAIANLLLGNSKLQRVHIKYWHNDALYFDVADLEVPKKGTGGRYFGEHRIEIERVE